MSDDLAIFGGPKMIERPQPHWCWPPKSPARTAAAVDYIENPKDNNRGYPLVVETFEKNFAAYHGRAFALGMNSGTTSLHAAFHAVGLGPGDEIIAPTMTFIATATPVMQLGASPVFCDCEPDTGNIDPADIRRKITPRTKAIVITHLCGHPCEMDEIMEIVRANDLYLIEDCSHAHGSTYNGKLVGTFGDIACFSLGRKILSSGEAGVLITDDRLFFERALVLSDFGPRLFHELTLAETKPFVDTGLGLKGRMNPLSATVLNVELAALDGYIAQRIEKLDYLSAGITGLPGLAPPVTRPGCTRGGYYSYRPFYDPEELNGLTLEQFMSVLHAEGMEIRRSNNPPLHRLQLFVDANGGDIADLPNSDKFFGATLSLPTFTLEPFDILDDYIRTFAKVCTYFSENRNVDIDVAIARAGI